MPSPSRSEIERQVSARARELAADALVDVLAELGYRGGDVVWRSHHGGGRGHSLVESVSFGGTPRRALVTLNLGLLGSESPLPSYMLKMAEHSPDHLLPFFAYFDHGLLERRVRSQWPERDATLGLDWASTRRNMNRLVRLDSPAMAHWLFRRVYPELEVAVRRAPGTRTIPTPPLTLGRSAIGDGSALGGVTTIACGGLSATLVTSEPRAAGGVPWQEESARRLRERLMPLLRDSDIGLKVTLVIRDRPSYLTLAPTSFLGLQPLQSGSSATQVLLFDGPIQAPAAAVGTAAAALQKEPAPPTPPSGRALLDAVTAKRVAAPAPAARPVDPAAAESYLTRIR